MQSRNYQDLSRGDDDRDFRQGRQDGTGQSNHTSEYGNYGMRDDHRHYDGGQQGSGYGGGGSNASQHRSSGSQYQSEQGNPGYQGGQQQQQQQSGQQGYRGGSFDTSQGGHQGAGGMHGGSYGQQSRQGANMNLGMGRQGQSG